MYPEPWRTQSLDILDSRQRNHMLELHGQVAPTKWLELSGNLGALPREAIPVH